jgi:AraC family transcriptional regulator of adaptative response/methylated-DNA-[protein]-cysteine methyltransferase
MFENGAAGSVTPDDPRWRALAARDRRADGQFVYSVRTTGVYCRPSCGARAARPENVAFHATPSDAARAGFRPCKRCRPDGPDPGRAGEVTVTDLCRFIAARVGDAQPAPTLEELAQRAKLSAFHLHRLFKSTTGLTPRGYAAAVRGGVVRDGLATAATVTDAIYDAGYGSSGRFYEAANQVLGMKPTTFRAGGAGMTIRYASAPSSLGLVLAAATERGVCAILLDDDPRVLDRELAERFPRALLVAGDTAFALTLARVIELVENPREATSSDLPLDIQGTAFQQRVWQALRRIPAGQTATYADIAAAIGAPRAVRAVGAACGANHISVAIPCHRVLRSDGHLSGYYWGVERKRALLEREGVTTTAALPAKRETPRRKRK